MEFATQYNKISNHFFFIANLAEWHFSCNPEYNKYWIKLTGPLSQKEKKILKLLKPIFKKYDFDDENTNHYLGKPFIDSAENKAWKNVANLVGKKEFTLLHKSFEIFENRFNIIWKKNQKTAKNIAAELNQKLKNKKISRIAKCLEILCGRPIANIVIHILIIPEQAASAAGGANTKKGNITLELRGKKDVEEGILILFHEIAHQCVRELNLTSGKPPKEIIKRLARISLFREQGIDSAWEELILITFLPDGILRPYLTGKPLSFKLKKKIDVKKRSHLENFIIYSVKDATLNYLKKKKTLDKNYADLVLKQAIKFARLKA